MKRVRRFLRSRWSRTHSRIAVVLAIVALLAISYSLYSKPGPEPQQRSNSQDLLLTPGTDNSALISGSIPETSSSKRVVYPYSIVPGGVRSPEELRKATAKDPLVAQHYAGFDYERARVVPVVQPELVYLSYRLKNKVYWTRKKIALHKGEYVITDGKITARTRCANQVSETAKPQVSPEEPPASLFEQPVGDGDGTAMQAPSSFESALLNRPGLEGIGPGLPPVGGSSLYSPGAGGYYPGILPPAIPGGGATGGHKPPTPPPNPPPPNPPPNPPPPGPPPAVVPEPGTLVLFSSGLAGLYWRFRKRK